MPAWTQNVMVKVLGIGVLAVLMLIPLAQVRGLVAERQQLREQALAQIAQGWGGRQVLGGLLLRTNTRRLLREADGRPPRVVEGSATLLPDTLEAHVDMAVQTRRYGIYGAPVYASTIQLTGRFAARDLARLRQANDLAGSAGKAELQLVLSDLQGLQQVSGLLINGEPARFESSAGQLAGWSTVVVPVDLRTIGEQPISFSMTLKVAGTQSLQLLPLARSTDVTMQAPWGDPSFVGAILPLQRDVTADRFSAHWHMLDLNRGYGQYWEVPDASLRDALRGSAFGVELYQPVDVYQRNERAGKYGLLFIAMTFVAFFLFEVLRRLRVHPVQYLMVGAALATFYVVLLALSEQIGFGPAYAVAASAVVLIVGGYAGAVLRARRAGLLLGAVLALVYALLYGLVAAEQYALLAGALVLLATVALMMFLTRRIDWYGYAPTTPAPAMMERS